MFSTAINRLLFLRSATTNPSATRLSQRVRWSEPPFKQSTDRWPVSIARIVPAARRDPECLAMCGGAEALCRSAGSSSGEQSPAPDAIGCSDPSRCDERFGSSLTTPSSAGSYWLEPCVANHHYSRGSHGMKSGCASSSRRSSMVSNSLSPPAISMSLSKLAGL